MLADPKTAAKPSPDAGRRHRGPVEVRLRFPSDPMAVRSALRSVLSGLSYLELSQDCCGNLELVLAEAMNNVVEHAHGGRLDGLIEVRVARAEDDGGAVVCELIDDGAPLPEGGPPEGSWPEIPPDVADLPEGGFGWMLIRELAHDLDYGRYGGRNRLRFRLDIAEG